MPSWRNRRLLDIAVVLISIGYPFLVYFGLMRFSPFSVAVALVVFLALRLLLQRRRAGRKTEVGIYLFVLAALFLLLLVDEMLAIKAYPVMISLSFAAVFGYSLFHPPSIIEKIARLREPELDAHAVQYTRKVTIAWVIFFISNAAISSWTALYASVETWTVYNGFISYILIGLMFGGELFLRQFVKQKKVS
ncbi:MAG: hypothetical protein K9G33_09500 [Sneathiella sp.]|nr:hypothetical protein [Sneathiella sp.]